MVEEELITIDWPVLPQRARYAEKSKAPPPSSKAVGKHVQTSRHVSTATKPTSALESLIGHPVTDLPAQAGGWEYLDHTADVQIHAWGRDDAESFSAAAVGMFAYMVELDEIDDNLTRAVVASGHDWESMLFAFLDECLYIFHTEAVVMKRMHVDTIDLKTWTVTATAHGGLFDSRTHKQGTEIKAITYSNMQIIHPGDHTATQSTAEDKRAQIYVIVDI